MAGNRITLLAEFQACGYLYVVSACADGGIQRSLDRVVGRSGRPASQISKPSGSHRPHPGPSRIIRRRQDIDADTDLAAAAVRTQSLECDGPG